MTNIGLQLFTYDQKQPPFQLLRGLDLLVDDLGKLKLIWMEHDGKRRTLSVEKALNDVKGSFRLNEGYIQTSPNQLRPGLRSLGVQDFSAHINISPYNISWAKTSDPASSGKPSIRNQVSWADSLERTMAYRTADSFPNTLELTLKCHSTTVEAMMEPMCKLLKDIFSSVNSEEKFGTLDFGGEWLFFPKSGFNPNVQPIYIFFCRCPKSDWPNWRKHHNVTLESIQGEAQLAIHSFELRRPLE